MKIDIREYLIYNEEEILKLYKSVGWANYTDNPEMLKNAFANSLCVLGAYCGDELVGVIRVVGDGFSLIYIQDILIFPEYQHQKIGTKLINEAIERYNNVYQIILVTDDTEKTVNFYESLGFIKLAKIGCVAFRHLAN